MNSIKLNELDPAFKFEIAAQPRGNGLLACFGCKACSASCPIGPIQERYDPRKIIRMALLGMRKEVLGSEMIWLCSSCYGCHEVCPQNVSFTEVMFAIKNLAAAEACMPPGLTAQKALLRAHGRLYEITEFENDKRAKLGLPPITEHPEDFATLL
ncbi:MAG: 4Fe-4S dicluster domain-containing protein [Pseudomonadota bacterium]